MGIRFACHVCEHPLNIKQELAGRVGVCPKCHARFRIPRADAPQSIPLEAADSDAQPALPRAEPAARAEPAPGGELTPRGAAQPDAAQPEPAQAEPPAPHSPLEDAHAQWYVRPPAGGQYGPATSDVMRSWIGENRITPSTLVWRQGWGQWRTAAEVLPEVQPLQRSGMTAATAPQSPSGGQTPQPVQLVGQAEIGHVRSARSQRRLMLVILLAATSVALVILLLVIALR